MKIVEGSLPHRNTWRALFMLAPEGALGKVWQLGLALAKANDGELLVAVIIPSELEKNLEAARAAVERVHAATPAEADVFTIIIQADDHEQGFGGLVQEAEVDLVLAHADGPAWYRLSNISCTVAAVRADKPAEGEPAGEDEAGIKRILVPTSGGPNTAVALALLLPLTPEVEVTAFYAAHAHLGPNEEALGRARLNQLLQFTDTQGRIQTKLVVTDSVIDGIVEEASQNYDLVILGASRESSIDKVLFGDIPGAVVRRSRKSVMIVRQPRTRFGSLLTGLAWRAQRLVPRMDLSARTQAYVRIRRSARPDKDFFVLIALSAMIAALGLIVNSPAVVIGAMLVAPLMSPIVGTGLAAVLGDVRFMRLSLGAVLRGVLLAIVVGAVAGLVHLGKPLTPEILARTEPSLLDLGIALFSGMAGAYSLSHFSAAASALPGVAIAAALVPPLAAAGITLTTGHFRESFGALLLFATNLVSISCATAIVFLILGFRPTPAQKARREIQARSVRLALALLALITVLLAWFTYQLTQESLAETYIREVVTQSVTEITGARIASLSDLIIEGDVADDSAPLHMDLTARSTNRIPHAQVVELQDHISTALQRPVGLQLTVIQVTELDPVVPPTRTPTPTATNTPTPGPTPTATNTPTMTPSLPPTPSQTPAPTETTSSQPTETPAATATTTPLPTATPVTAVIDSPYGLNLRADPGRSGEVLALLETGTVVVVLDGRETADDQTWIQVAVDGQIGWVSEAFLVFNP